MEQDWTTGAIKFWLSVALRGVVVGLWVGVLIYLGAAIGKISEAHADVLCAHRGEAHAAQQHTTREADSRWHVEHGQLPTCDLSKGEDRGSVEDHRSSSGDLDKDQKHSDSHQDHDSDLPGHRDHAGVHCYRLHCG